MGDRPPNRGRGQNYRGRWRNRSVGPNWRERTNGPTEQGFPVRRENYGGAYNNPQDARGGASSRGGRPSSRPPRFGFKKLEQIIAKAPEEALLEIIKLKDDILSFINVELSNDCIVLLVKLFANISDSNYKNNVASVLSLYTNKVFSEKLEVFIVRLPLQGIRERINNKLFWEDVDGFFRNLSYFCNALLDTIPKKSAQFLPVIFKAVVYTFPNLEHEFKIVISDEIKLSFENLQEKLATLMQDDLKRRDMTKIVDGEVEEVDPLDDYRDISIYPLSEELLSQKSSGIRKNKIEGGYSSVEQYLDIQFRLLREDFVAPMRQGIAEYLCTRQAKKKISNIKIYKDVSILYKKLVNSEMGDVVQVFAKGHLRNVERTKRLMFGSLVAFTEDNFQTLIFGKVVDRDIQYLKKGQVVINFNDNAKLKIGSLYTMIECLVYFEPYYHVLKALQHMNVDKFPLKQYLVDVQDNFEIPGYMEINDSFLYSKNVLQELPGDYDELLDLPLEDVVQTYDLSLEAPNTWPDLDVMGLNQGQYNAFKAALTRKFCIIQGPPGTGKTFLGLKIAKVLLANKSKWSNIGPMLVICYTNHALDQFLEGLTTETKSVVRVGGQSRSEEMKKYNLKNHRFNYSKETPALRNKRDALRNQTAHLGALNNEFHNIVEGNGIMDLFNLDCFEKIDRLFMDSWFSKASRGEILNWLLEEAVTWNVNLQQAQNVEDDETVDIEEVQLGNQNLKHTIDLDDETEIVHREVLQLTSVAVLNNNINKITKIMKTINEETDQYRECLRELRFAMQTREYLKYKMGYLRNEFNNFRKPANINYRQPHQMGYNDRWHLYRYWVNQYRINLIESIQVAEKVYQRLFKEYEEVREMYDALYMKKCDVIGMTTTGAARLQTTLMTLRCPIVIVEEAAEVLEAHIVTALTDKCQHLVLIGDHKQLRPSTADFTMDKKFNLGISLFERMILNGFNSNMLKIQHRMRPDISDLVSPSIYRDLEDHVSVRTSPPIKGVHKSLYFITHVKPEQSSSDSSKENAFEATFLILLANHLVLNGYRAEDITILSAYSGQFFRLLKERKLYDRLKDVKITILDNYQGEENKIILLSLVRNNDDDSIGFLRLENRVCVALSRAKLGLYIMGNIDLLCRNSEIWPKIRMVLEEKECLGTSLPLVCQKHPENTTLITNIEDFNKVPEGGCSLLCGLMRSCGHRCENMCHIIPHSSYECFKPCLKILCELNHPCPKLCKDQCGNCMVPKLAVLPCKHIDEIPCYLEPDQRKCNTIVTAKLKCGHTVKKECHVKIKDCPCTYPCEARIEPCGHACTNKCHISIDPDHLEYKCYKACERPNKYCSNPENPDHKCPKLCSDKCSPCDISVKKRGKNCSHVFEVKCSVDVNTIFCNKKCKRLLPCGHACLQRCSDPCGNCAVMVKKIIDGCGHEVMLPCSKIPEREDCTKDCTAVLDCGHKCVLKCSKNCYAENCMQIITINGKTCPCGHTQTVPCYLKDTCTPKDALKYCTAKCNVTLACEHKCGGTCSECHQNRLHVPCKEKCNSTLLCGHDCNVPCRTMCQPCTRPCGFRCKHSRCKKKCGDPCTNCVERCTRRCEHMVCNKLCHEICEVPPCSKPCTNKLKCGHDCIGYCGDPCPPLCLICDKDTVTDIFFGTETDEGSRFVYLEECKHVLEGSGLDQWFSTATNSNEIASLFCPKCKTVVSKTQRYSDYIKASFKDLQSVKKKYYGNFKLNKQQYEGLVVEANILSVKYYSIGKVSSIINEWKLAFKRIPNQQVIEDLKIKLQILKELCETYKSETIIKFETKKILSKYLKVLLTYLQSISNISKQNILDYNLEFKKFTRIVLMCKIMETAKIDYKNLSEYITCKTMAENFRRYSDVQDIDFKTALEAFNKKTQTGLNVTEKERKDIVAAMSMGKGHWFKCPQGHIYAIGDCGGAMVESKCPECGSKIGGTNHALLRDNALAPEMDNAQYPAYSDMANILNFDLN